MGDTFTGKELAQRIPRRKLAVGEGQVDHLRDTEDLRGGILLAPANRGQIGDLGVVGMRRDGERPQGPARNPALFQDPPSPA